MPTETIASPSAVNTKQFAARWVFVGCVLSIAIAMAAGLALVLSATHSGPGLSPDSLDYLRGARSLIDGHGFGLEGSAGGWKAETHLAPLFPAVLSIITSQKTRLYQVSRFVNATLFAINMLLAAELVTRCVDTQRRLIGAAAGAAAVGLSPVLVEVHSMVWSEPLFIALWFTSLLMLQSFEGTGGYRWLIGSAIAAALACITRYSALSQVMAIMLTLAVGRQTDRTAKQRWLDAVGFGAIACFPIVLLVLRNFRLTGNAADRTMSFHPPERADWHIGMVAVSGWLLPHANRTWVVVGACTVGVITVIVCTATWRFFRKNFEDSAARSMQMLLCFAAVYAAFLMCSVTLFDAHTVFDNRILCPLYLPLLLLTVITIVRYLPGLDSTLSRPASWTAMRIVVLIIAIGLFSAETVRATKWTGWARSNGLGYSNTRWKNSELLRYARSLPPGAIIYSNAPDALLLFSETNARPLPKVALPGTKAAPTSYRDELLQMRGALKSKNVFIFFFHRVGRSYLVSELQLNSDLRLSAPKKFQDGTMYTLRTPAFHANHVTATQKY